MYTLEEEARIIICLVIFGIYLFSFIDLFDIVVGNIKNKYIKIITYIIMWIFQLFITFIISYNIMNGYVPIYFVLFIYIGYIIYKKLVKRYFIKIINIIFLVLNKVFKQMIKVIKPCLYSKKIINFINREITIIKKCTNMKK